MGLNAENSGMTGSQFSDKLLQQLCEHHLRKSMAQRQDVYEADMPVQLVMSNALGNSYRCTH